MCSVPLREGTPHNQAAAARFSHGFTFRRGRLENGRAQDPRWQCVHVKPWVSILSAVPWESRRENLLRRAAQRTQPYDRARCARLLASCLASCLLRPPGSPWSSRCGFGCGSNSAPRWGTSGAKWRASRCSSTCWRVRGSAWSRPCWRGARPASRGAPSCSAASSPHGRSGDGTSRTTVAARHCGACRW